MKTARDIQALFQDAGIGTHPAADRAVLDDALQAGGLTLRTRPARSGQTIWRFLMNNRITKPALAAGTTLAILLGLYVGNPFCSTVTWADVQNAFLAQRWVHVKYDNGEERWSNLQTGDYYLKRWDGTCVAVDYARNVQQACHPVFGRQISEARPDSYNGGPIPPWEPRTAWDSEIGVWERMAEHGGEGHWEVERHSDRTNGAESIRFDCYYNDAAGRRLLLKQIWADPQTRLPLIVSERLSRSDRQEQKPRFKMVAPDPNTLAGRRVLVGPQMVRDPKTGVILDAREPVELTEQDLRGRESRTAVFDFPETGPSSIHDLGVPRDLPVVKEVKETVAVPVPAIAEVLEAAKAASARLPLRYRAAVWADDGTIPVVVTWRDGPRLHKNRYTEPSPGHSSQHRLNLPATTEDILLWTSAQLPISTLILDGQRIYDRRYSHVAHPGSRDEVRVTWAKNSDPSEVGRHAIAEQWAYMKEKPASFERIDDPPEELSEYIGLRIQDGDARRDYYIDAERDYAYVRWISWRLRSGQWEKESQRDCSGFIRLVSGQWYASKRTVVIYPAPEEGAVPTQTNWNIDVQPLGEGDFPPDTFNGERLMEGAKVETH
ncbi:MAG: hypothetical protein KBE65_08235 [Phycisphaerae bacterium]|nr:hypothetical protein [Phycisphaerae bacterium]